MRKAAPIPDAEERQKGATAWDVVMSDLDELLNTKTKYHIYDIFVNTSNGIMFAHRMGYKKPLTDGELEALHEWANDYFGDNVIIEYMYKRPLE